MADISITPANVIAAATATLEDGTFGEAVDAGEVVYRDTSDGKSKLADCDSGTAAAQVPRGIALNGGGDGQPGRFLTEGDLTVGEVLTPGVSYYLSSTAGKICPYADLGSGDRVVHVGVAKSASVLAVLFNDSGATL
ncbi:hypothetical protein [Oceaniradius stylonematis]|uniref:hypothetical protein n=1 Tax=Oceaniradius stylonematis TaxID=2184161 RepID=UPI003B5C1097